MEPYLFHGIVRPERAVLSLKFAHEFPNIAPGIELVVKGSIVLNQVACWVESDHDWDVFELRDIVKNIVQTHLAIVGFLKGYAYDFEIVRVLNQTRARDYVFGIDIRYLAEPRASVDLQNAGSILVDKTFAPNGIFLRRCFGDLVSSMKDVDDTAFYCYRAIESLRHHCAAIYALPAGDKLAQWKKFREVAGCDKKTILAIKDAADPLRHGEPFRVSSEERARMLTTTWGIVEAYLGGVQTFRASKACAPS
jgi:hypothetical protein